MLFFDIQGVRKVCIQLLLIKNDTFYSVYKTLEML